MLARKNPCRRHPPDFHVVFGVNEFVIVFRCCLEGFGRREKISKNGKIEEIHAGAKKILAGAIRRIIAWFLALMTL